MNDSNLTDGELALFIIIMLVIGLLIGAISAHYGTRDGLRKSAIDANVAEYQVNKLGETFFVWKTNIVNK